MKELFTALCKAQAEMGHARKDTNNPFYKSKYADLAAVIDSSRDVLTKHGLSIIQLVNGNELHTMLCHNSGEFVTSTTPLISKDPHDPQKVAGAITYFRRYAYQAIICQISDDDDGKSAAQPPKFTAPVNQPFDLATIVAAFRRSGIDPLLAEVELEKKMDAWTNDDMPALRDALKKLKEVK